MIVLAFSVLLEGLRVSINHVVDGFFLFLLLLSAGPREFFDPHRQVDQFDEVSDAKIDFKGSSDPSHFIFEINVGKSRRWNLMMDF